MRSQIKGINITPVEVLLIVVLIIISFVVGLNVTYLVNPEFSLSLFEQMIIGLVVAVVTGVILSVFISKS